MNWARDTVESADPARLALVERSRDGARREWTFGEVAREVRAVAARLAELGARRGDVVLTLVGNRPEWVATMVACFVPHHAQVAWRRGGVGSAVGVMRRRCTRRLTLP